MTARILVVDDTPANLRLLEAKLTAEYFEVVTATDGPSALELAASNAPDLILLDIMMPGIDGFEVAERLKSDPNTQHIPIVMVTALTEPTDRVRGLEAGADDFLSKPVNDVALFARVRSLTRLKVMMDELRIRHMATGRFQMAGKDPYGDDGGAITGKVLLVNSAEPTAGLVQGYMWADLAAWEETIRASMPYWLVRSISGTAIIVAQFIFAYNMVRTLAMSPSSSAEGAYEPGEVADRGQEGLRSEERRGGKGGRSRWSPYH